MKSGIVGLIPVKTGPARGLRNPLCQRSPPALLLQPSNDTNMMARYLGNDNRA